MTRSEGLAVIGRLEGASPHSDNLMRVCCGVAAADHGSNAEELEATTRFFQLLPLDLADYNLLEAT